MGLVKVKKLAPGKVKFIHQLNDDGTPYAEDVTVESSVPGRLDYFEKQEGKVGVVNLSFSPYDTVPEGLKFPDEA